MSFQKIKREIEMELPNRIVKPSGWKGSKTDKWYTRSTKHGCQYMCPYCGKPTLGCYFGEQEARMHFNNCPTLIKDGKNG